MGSIDKGAKNFQTITRGHTQYYHVLSSSTELNCHHLTNSKIEMERLYFHNEYILFNTLMNCNKKMVNSWKQIAVPNPCSQGPHLCTRIRVLSMIGLSKKAFADLPIRMKGNRNALPIKESFGAQNKDLTPAWQTFLAKISLRKHPFRLALCHWGNSILMT